MPFERVLRRPVLGDETPGRCGARGGRCPHCRRTLHRVRDTRVQNGTQRRPRRCRCMMNEPLPILLESSMMIAWDYLERTGELGDPDVASQVLLDSIEGLIRNGERRKLMLSNKAIDAYKRYRADRHLALVS